MMTAIEPDERKSHLHLMKQFKDIVKEISYILGNVSQRCKEMTALEQDRKTLNSLEIAASRFILCNSRASTASTSTCFTLFVLVCGICIFFVFILCY